MKNEIDTLPGSRIRAGHRSTLFAILGAAKMIPVRSAGDRFYMEGAFPYRHLLLHVADYAEGKKTAAQIAAEINHAIAGVPSRITIAETADTVTRRTALALMGGAYHEGFHRLWSGQGQITERDVARIYAAGGVDATVPYRQVQQLMADLQNILEDIRIERLGCVVFPGVVTKMADLADFILDAEKPVREAHLKGGVNAAQIALSVLRDVGLGYNTVKVREAMAHYRKVSPDAVNLVLNGALTPILREITPDLGSDRAVKASESDVGLSTILALKAIKALVEASKDQQPQTQPGQPGQDGDSDSDDEGDSDEGDSGSDEGDSGSDDESDEGSGGGSDGEDESKEPTSGKGGGSESGEESGEGKSKGEGKSGNGSDGQSKGKPSVNDATGSEESGSGGNGSGGGAASNVAADILKDGQNGAGLQDYASALQGEIKDARKEEDASLEKGERAYRPATTSGDREIKITADPKQSRKVDRLASTVRSETSFLKAKLRTMFRAMEDGAREHGLKRGPVLSERFLVDTVASIRGGTDPRRAFAADDVTLDMSVAAVTVIDQSGSMHDKLDGAAQIAYAINDALDAIGAKSAITGFTTNGSYGGVDYQEARAMGAHRVDGVDIDVFKTFDDRFRSAAPRLGSLRCSGGTPMSDGIEHALRLLTNRREGYRVIFVLTDGIPDGGHAEVMKSQFRRAEEAGIVIVGVGLGRDSEYVTKTFDHHVYGVNLADIPRPLVAKLHELVLGGGVGQRRGRKVRAA